MFALAKRRLLQLAGFCLAYRILPNRLFDAASSTGDIEAANGFSQSSKWLCVVPEHVDAGPGRGHAGG